MSGRRWRFDYERPPVRDGARLHREVPAERWCVTKWDLLEFRALVSRHVAEARILPTARDQFSASDDRVGPCIHTVNNQLIVPITRRAGCASWALMMHPEGLLCDVFVTHGWDEGAYEFVDKVCNSWPLRARHAYCCMLSNPQCLDVGNLISAPRESPFAQALFAAPCMLVVPNSKISIYSRVWCAYEAFLAHSEGKVILTASAPLPHLAHHIAIIGSVYIAACGAFVAALCFDKMPRMSHKLGDGKLLIANFIVYASLLFVASIRPYAWTRAILLGIAVGSGYAFAMFAVAALELVNGSDKWVLNSEVALLLLRPLANGLAVVVAEADRLKEIQSRDEARQLRKGYTGFVKDAECSVAEDKMRIMAELAESGLEQEVDEAIEVLLVAGVSTPELRTTFLRSGILEQVGRIKWALAFIAWIDWVCFFSVGIVMDAELQLAASRLLRRCSHSENRLSCVMAFAQGGDVFCDEMDTPTKVNDCLVKWSDENFHPTLPIAIFGLLSQVVWLWLLVYLPKAFRSFAVRVLVCSSSLAYVARLVLAMDMRGKMSFQGALNWYRILAIVSPFATLALSAAGPAWVSGIPGLGPCVVRCLWQPSCLARRGFGGIAAAAARIRRMSTFSCNPHQRADSDFSDSDASGGDGHNERSEEVCEQQGFTRAPALCSGGPSSNDELSDDTDGNEVPHERNRLFDAHGVPRPSASFRLL